MRFMVMCVARRESEAGASRATEQVAALQQYVEGLTKAGIVATANGLAATSVGACVKRHGERRTVIDGPFAETKELIAGFWAGKMKY